MRPPVRPPRLRCALFPLTYPPHLLVLPATFGLHLFWQTYPYFRALYVIPVRRTRGLPTASFRFHLTMDTLAFGYTLPTTRACYGLSPVRARPWRANQKKSSRFFRNGCSLFHLFFIQRPGQSLLSPLFQIRRYLLRQHSCPPCHISSQHCQYCGKYSP